MVRSGHSLPELIVALAFLGTTTVAVGAAGVTGARWAADGVQRQRAVREATAALDSVSAVDSPTSGDHTAPGIVLRWTVEPVGDGHAIRITATSPQGRLLTTLEGTRLQPLEVLPFAGAASGSAP